MTNNNVLTQRKGETLEQYIARVRAMSSEEIQEASEQQKAQVLNGYQKATKPSSYRRKVYHK